MRFVWILILITLSINAFSTPSARQPVSFLDPSVMIIEEKYYIGKIIKDFKFVLEDGNIYSIKEFTKDKPTIILPLFYKCMTGCPIILSTTLRNISRINRDFNLLVLSFDSNDTIEDLVHFRESHSGNYTDKRVKYGILTPESVNIFTNSTGFKFFFSKRDNTFVHTLVLIFLSPEGKIVRYLIGSNPKEQNINLALAEASIGKFSINSVIDLAFLVCYTYDSNIRGYELNPTVVFGGLGALLVVLTLVTSIIIKRRNKQ